jgi:hypothetical protein
MKVDYDYELQNNLDTERSSTDLESVYDTEITVLALILSLLSAHCEAIERILVLVPKE